MKLDDRTRELIAVGSSIAIDCGPCAERHSTKALEAGADADMVAEAAGTGRNFRKGGSPCCGPAVEAAPCCSPSGEAGVGCC